jgi:hypothetical protein
MKAITSHHDGHGRMERLIVLATDDPATDPPGNSSHHRYEFFQRPPALGDSQAPDIPVATIQFQRGPFDDPDSTPGTLSNAVLAALIDHLQGFQDGQLKNRHTALAITKLEEAAHWLRARADERAAAGTLGTMKA